MGFDNECILNIQSLAGEYFCPVCRLLVYPNEALQSQCTHLYCKPCLTYVVSTTRACPYDGYLVTEADSKPLVESNKTLAETIGKIAVHCLYHRSGCTWQGQLSECITHCTGCAFGNSPVVCNRCGTQIVHRQVQEHAQNCPGVQPQAQQAEGNQNVTTATGATTPTEQNQATAQATASVAQTQAVQAAVVPTSGQDINQANTSQPQTAVQAVPTPEQLYQQQQQQYQQYYQQYPGYDPYQQHYPQYGAYQPGYQQYPQQNPPQSTPGQQPQMYMQQPQPQLPIRPQATQAQPQAQTQLQPLPQSQLQAQPQQPHSQPQSAHQHAQVGLQPQVQTHVNMPNQIQPSHSYPQAQAYPQQPQSYSQPQPHQTQLQAQPQFQQRPHVPLQQQPNPQHPQPHQQTYPYPQSQPMAQTQLHSQPQAQLQARPQTLPHHPSQAVTGHQSYPQPQPNQQLPPGPPQLQSVHMHPQQQGAPTHLPQPAVQMQPHFSQQQMGQMRPPHSHVPMQQQQQQPPAMLPQGQRPNIAPAPLHVHPHTHQQQQPIHQYPGVHPPHQQSLAQQSAHGQSLHPQAFPGQAPGLVQSTQQAAHFIPQQAIQAQVRLQAPSSVLPAGSHAQQQFQQNVSTSHGQQSHQSQNYPGRGVLPNQGMPHQPFQPSTAGSSADAKMTQPGGNLPYPPNIRPQSSTEQQLGYVNLPPQSSNDTSTQSYGSNMQVSSVKATMSDTQAEAASQSADVKEANESKSDFETQVMDGDKKSVNESEGMNSHSKSDVKEISESQALQKDTSSSQDGLDEPVVKNMLREEVSGQPESSASGLLPETAAQNSEGISYNGNKQDEKSQLEDKEVQDDVKRNLSSQKTEMPNGNDEKVSVDVVGSQGKVLASDRHSRGQMQDRVYAQSGHVVSVSDNHQLQPNYGPSHTQAQLHQRPPQPDQLPPLNSHPQQMQIPGPPPTHLRPQGNSLHGNVLLQGPPSSAPAHFQQPFGNQPIGSFHPEISPVSGLGPGPVGRGPGPFSSQGNLNVGPMPAHYAGDSAGGLPFGGPPPGSFDSQGQIMGRMPPQGMQMPDAEFIPSKRPGYFDGRHPDLLPGTADRIPLGQPSIMQLESGAPARGPASGLSNPSYPFNLQEERFKHFPEERYRQFPGGFNLPGGERLSNFPVESGRRDINQREFFEDLKRFPRPGHLDPMNNPKSESYFSSSRPLDRAPHGFSSEARGNLDASASSAASRLLPPYQGGGFLRDDNAGRKIDHGGVHPDFHLPTLEPSRLRMDGLPRLRSPGREYPDIPLNRFGSIEDGDGRAFGERSKPFGVHPDSNPYFERRFSLLPSHLRRGEFDAPGNSRIGDRVHLRGGDLVGPDILQSSGPLGPRNLHMGEPGGYGTFPNPSRLGDMPLNSRPGFNGGMPSRGPSDGGFFNAGEAESLDHSRKRKHGSMGWCRICKVDCETIEGLEMHSQSREHQKVAMDMVLNIKKDNAKKQKVSSDEHISHEGDANKSRKASINNQGE